MSTDTNTPAPQPTPPESTEIDLAGDVVEKGIQKNAPQFQDDLRWWFRYSSASGFSDAECARQLGIDAGTYSKVLRGRYTGGNDMVLPPPAKMLSRIRLVREQEREAAQTRNAGRVKTPTVDQIWNVCRKAHHDRLIAFVFGESHVGKSEALKWYRDENNHGTTIYVDLQGANGVQDIYRFFARALRISADTPVRLLMPRVLAAIDRANLVIVDEFHHITYGYQKGASNRMVNALKSIKDRTGCGMVICATDVGREEFETGKENKLLKQLWRRGTIKLQLANALPVADVRAFAQAYGLPFPEAPEDGSKDFWKALRAAHPQFEGLDVCERAAYDFGVQHLVSVLQDGSKFASKRKRDLTWKDVRDAQSVYDQLSAKKSV